MKFSWLFVIMIFSPVILNAKMSRQKSIIQKREEHFCIVKEHEKQMTKFNFTQLSNVPDDYIIKRDESQGESVYVQLCSSLKNNCNGKTGYSICLKKKDKEIGIGKFPPKVELNSTAISFHFIGDKCNKASNYTTIIIMQCDYDSSGNNSFPQIFPHADEDQCDIYLIWSTFYACGPRHKTNCSAFDATGHEYDLSPLTLSSYNYEVRINKTLKIILNVCHSLIYGNGASCNQHTASCLQNSTSVNNSYTDLGEIGNPPFIDKGILKIEYNLGGMCRFGGEPHLKTIIAFICDPTAENTIPTYINGIETCIYYLEWKTPLACKEPLRRNETLIPIAKNQVIVSPTTLVTRTISEIKPASDSHIKCARVNDEINLLLLIRTEADYIVKTNDSEFYINVCNPLVSTANLTACDGSSACKIHYGEIKQEISLGKPEGSPVIDENKNVVLQYKGGTTCVENQKESISSNLSFVCNYTVNSGSPEFLKYTNCTYLFKWETKFVCGTVIGNFYDNCTISNPLSQTINFSPLSKQTFYMKNSKGKQYSLSLCGEKNRCKNSTVCQGDNGYGSSVNVVYEFSNNSVNLNFTKGTKCFNGTYESEIKFVCNSTAGLGMPKLIGESECSAHFEWQTNVICSSQMNIPSENPAASSETKDVEAQKESTSNHGGLGIFIISGIVIIIIIVILLRNPSTRARCSRFFSSPCSSSSNDRVKYCRVNTTEEARLLLDNVDPTTVCQSDSDDDLLGA